jgi:creatine kinase
MKSPAKDNFPDYSDCKCMTGKHLTLEMYERLYNKVTPNGVTLDKCIQCSVDSADRRIIGLLAGDEESYDVFKELFDAVINEKHLGFGPNDKQPAPDLSPELKDAKLDEKYVRSCRIRTGRSIRGLCLPPAMSRAERREVARLLETALASMSGDLAGKYYPLATMNKDDYQRLIDDHFLFQKPTGHLMVNSTAIRDWPDARGIWHNNEKTFLVWVNEEDHCRVISMQLGGDMAATFERFCRALKLVEKNMREKAGREFMWSERLGYLTACPSNIGTGIRCSVHIQLKNLSKREDFDDIMWGLGLQKRGTGGEHTEAVDDVYDVSNRARLKQSERQFVQLLVDGVHKLIEMEKRLEEGKTIDDLLPPKKK